MFTGLIHELGTIVTVERRGDGARIEVRRRGGSDPLARGESIAVSGVCLTALPIDGESFAADVSPETLSRTTLAGLQPGMRVNLERALAIGERLGGHMVQGHVDDTGTIVSIDHEGDFAVYHWSYADRFAPLVVEKGSIAVDGVSLTIVEPERGSFGAALIPETLAKTSLGDARVGDRSNLEFDVMAKYAGSLMMHYLPQGRR
ncbi:MAG TPA: riboflavin synthase [Thermoanaerobaculia bacterium]|nr:riboflavin synthase [Thermoanaerobaculia bacterium]